MKQMNVRYKPQEMVQCNSQFLVVVNRILNLTRSSRWKVYALYTWHSISYYEMSLPKIRLDLSIAFI